MSDLKISRSRGQFLRSSGLGTGKPPPVFSAFIPVLSFIGGAGFASETLLPVLPGKGVIWPGRLRQPEEATVRINPKTNSLVKSVSFMFYLFVDRASEPNWVVIVNYFPRSGEHP